MKNIQLTRGIMFQLFLLFSILVFSQNADTTAWSVEIEDIVVTAQYAPTDSKNALHKVKTINMATIQNRGITDLEKLLEHELNIRVNQDMILGSSINLQGMSGQNVKVMVDGVPVIGRVGDNIDISQISLHNVARIEIIEGPLSVNYGTNALGGVINIITRKSQVKRYDLNLASSYESTSEKEVNAGFGMRLLPKLLFRGEGNFFKFDGFNSNPFEDETFERTHQWNPKVKKNISGLLRYNYGQDGMVAFRSNYFDEEIQNYGVIKRPVFKPYAFDEYYLTNRFDQHLMTETTVLKDYYLNASLAYNHFRREKQVVRYDFDDDLSTELPAEQDTSVFNSWVLRPVIASKYKKSRLNFQIGADLNFEEGFGSKISDETQDTIGYSALGDYAVFSSLNYKPVTPLDIQLGVRLAYNTRFKTPLIPSLNLKYNLGHNLIIRGSYARGFRAPTLKELFLYFVDSNHYIVGNSDLQPEISDNYQLDLDWHILPEPYRLTFTLGSFYNDIRSKIDLYDFVEVDGEMIPAAELGKTTLNFTYFNQDRFKSLGLNLGLALKSGGFSGAIGFAPIGRYNLLPEEVTDVDPFSYVLESNADLNYDIKKIGLSFHFYIKHNNKLIRYYVDYDDDGNAYTNQSEFEGYFLSDFNIVKKFWNKRIQLNLGVKNIFDVKNVNYVNLASGTPGGGVTEGQFPVGKGRKWHVGLIFHLESRS
jgi:outer membrane receptor for ferrienterochelin and colicins